jgi:two-component sensor histidine kinase
MKLIEGARRIRQNRPRSLAWVAAIAFTDAVVTALLASDLRNSPFITLFPAVALCTLLGGTRAGVVVAILGGLATWYWILPATQVFNNAWDTLLPLVMLFISNAIFIFLVSRLNLAVDRLVQERDKNAVLFEELQHRVANNISFISATLRMQKAKMGPDMGAAADILDSVDARLMTMSRLHRRLYNPSAVDQPLATYLQSLLDDLLAGNETIRGEVDGQDIRLDMSRAVTVSLLLSELVTNAVKHGFHGRSEGRISVTLFADSGRIRLSVKDNGTGPPPGFDFEASKGLGSRIIKALVQQLDGTLEWHLENGMEVRVVFPA